jgi:hypothetical protein
MNQLSRLSLSLLYVAASLAFVGCAGGRYEQSTGEWIDSKSLNARVKAALVDDPVVKGTDIDVDVWKEVVQLNGFVDTEEQRQRAEKVAWGIEGVRGVDNNLAVKTDIPSDQISTSSSRQSQVLDQGQTQPRAQAGSPEFGASASAALTEDAPDASGAASASASGGVSSGGQRISAAALSQSPDQYLNSELLITGVVQSVVGETAFTLGPSEDEASNAAAASNRAATTPATAISSATAAPPSPAGSPNTVLIIADDDTVSGLRQGDPVVVQGKARKMDRLELERDLQVRIDDTGAAQWKGGPVVIADSVRLEK